MAKLVKSEIIFNEDQIDGICKGCVYTDEFGDKCNHPKKERTELDCVKKFNKNENWIYK